MPGLTLPGDDDSAGKGDDGPDAFLPGHPTGDSGVGPIEDLDENARRCNRHTDGGKSPGVGGEVVVETHRDGSGHRYRQGSQNRHQRRHDEATKVRGEQGE